MLHRSLAASDAERRRIAADLHDGVVQDLAATSIALAGAAVEPPIGRAAATSRAACTSPRTPCAPASASLRSLVVDIHPPNLRRTGLAAALGDLAATTTRPRRRRDAGGRRRRDARARLPARAVRVPRGAGGAAQRRHPRRGAAVELRLAAGAPGRGDLLALTVTDDGVGFDPAAVAPDDRPRMGLRLLDDLAGDVGGRIDVTSAPGAGTTVTMEVPV